MRKGGIFIYKKGGLQLAIIEKEEKIIKYLRKDRADISLLPNLLLPVLLLHLFLLLSLIFLIVDQVNIDVHALEVCAEIGMVVSNLFFSKIETLAKIFGSWYFNNFLKVI